MSNNKNNRKKALLVSGIYQWAEEEQAGNCPSCGADVMDSYNEILCGKCGQKLKWEQGD
jgi:ribosomal protein S27AE